MLEGGATMIDRLLPRRCLAWVLYPFCVTLSHCIFMAVNIELFGRLKMSYSACCPSLPLVSLNSRLQKRRPPTNRCCFFIIRVCFNYVLALTLVGFPTCSTLWGHMITHLD